MNKKLNQLINQELKILRKHFKEDKWNLDYNFIKDSIMDAMLPGVSDYIFTKLAAGPGWTMEIDARDSRGPIMLVSDKRAARTGKLRVTVKAKKSAGLDRAKRGSR